MYILGNDLKTSIDTAIYKIKLVTSVFRLQLCLFVCLDLGLVSVRSKTPKYQNSAAVFKKKKITKFFSSPIQQFFNFTTIFTTDFTTDFTTNYYHLPLS